jgi:DNA-binding Xre family transcriptional regulator
MLSLYINEFLLKKGYKSGPWALRKIGMPTSAAYTLSQPGVRTIKLDQLEHICQIFDCTPNDLLNYQPGQKDLLPPGHSLMKLQKDNSRQTPMELVKQLRPEEIDEASAVLEEMIKRRSINNE